MSDFDKSVKRADISFSRPIETEKFSGSVDPEIPAKHLLIKIIVSKWAICQAAFIRRRGVLNRKLRAHVTALEFGEYKFLIQFLGKILEKLKNFLFKKLYKIGRTILHYSSAKVLVNLSLIGS